MPGTPEHRTGVDRRSRPRGGRRAGDAPGFAPLVLLLDEDADNGARCEAILAKLRFAVAPARTIEEAIRVMAALRPNIVVARVTDEKRLRQATPSGVPLVILTDEHAEPEPMLAAIRKAIRTSRQS